MTSSLESLAKVVTNYPKASEMFASFLAQKLNLQILGYFERVSESAMQYANRLLAGKNFPKSIDEIAKNFVYEYKDHSFVIDKEEAMKHLGDLIKLNTPEYYLANEIHQFMSMLNMIAGLVKKKNIGIIGNCSGIIGESNAEQIDGVIHFADINLSIVAEFKDYTKNLNIEPIAKLRNQLLRRPANAIGSIFSTTGFTMPALILTQFLAPQTILLWETDHIEHCITNKLSFKEGILRKYRHAIEEGNPNCDITI